jgi:hypothetical protein
MKVVFSVDVDREKKTLNTKVCCPQCREEVQMEMGTTMAKFKCAKHGDLGSMSIAEFRHAFESTQKSVAQREGFTGKPRSQEYFIPADPKKMS